MKSYSAIFILSAIIGFAAGKLTQETTTQSESLSSIAAMPPDTYECPSKDELANLLETIHFVGESLHDCNDPRFSKLGKVLKFMQSANTQLPANWVGARDVIESPVHYLASMATTVQLDLTQRANIAFNQGKTEIIQGQAVSQHHIHLGGRFLSNDVLDSAITLLHEARHSDPSDPGHVTCRWGDIAGTTGGCDQIFSTDSVAGAYSYATLIGLAWAEHLPALTTAQREYLYSVAFFRVASRFNLVPYNLAVPIEQIYVLDDVGDIKPISPLTGELQKPLQITKPIKRIQFFENTNGFIAYSGTSSYLYTPNGEFEGGFFGSSKLKVYPIRDVTRLPITDKSDRVNFIYMITDENRFKFVDIDPKTGEKFVNDADVQPDKFHLTLVRLTHARNQRYALSDKRETYRLDEFKSQIEKTDFNIDNGFRQLDGGLFYSSLIGVTSNGEIKFYDSKKNQIVDIEKKYSAPVIKYQNSISFTAALLNDNKIELHFFDGRVRIISLNTQRKIKDLVVTRSYLLNQKTFGQTVTQPAINEAVQSCNFIKAYPGIWSNDLVGITQNKKIATFNSKTKTCTQVDLSRFNITNESIQSLELEGSPNFNEANFLSYPSITIRKLDNSSMQLQPYTF